jgi:hypothetical protein
MSAPVLAARSEEGRKVASAIDDDRLALFNRLLAECDAQVRPETRARWAEEDALRATHANCAAQCTQERSEPEVKRAA